MTPHTRIISQRYRRCATTTTDCFFSCQDISLGSLGPYASVAVSCRLHCSSLQRCSQLIFGRGTLGSRYTCCEPQCLIPDHCSLPSAHPSTHCCSRHAASGLYHSSQGLFLSLSLCSTDSSFFCPKILVKMPPMPVYLRIIVACVPLCQLTRADMGL